MSSYLVVIGDRKALVWILTSEQMAFSERTSRMAASLKPDDKLLLYTTRGCFGNPTLGRGRVIGQATVANPVRRLDKPVQFGDRTFPVGCSLTVHLLAPFGTGVEVVSHVAELHAFPKPDVWSVYLRRTLVALDDHDYGLLLRPLSKVAVVPSQVVPEYVARGAPRQLIRPTMRDTTG